MLGKKIYKNKTVMVENEEVLYVKTKAFRDEYSELLSYCYLNGCMIEDKGDYYECVTPPAPPEPTVKEKLEREMNQLEAYLKNTDYMAIKCGEKGLSMANEYPNEFYRRQACRDRINEIREALKRY